jgi:hypothetical protein
MMTSGKSERRFDGLDRGGLQARRGLRELRAFTTDGTALSERNLRPQREA